MIPNTLRTKALLKDKGEKPTKLAPPIVEVSFKLF